MSAFLVPLAAFLAAVFAVSAVGKLRSADRGRGAFTALRIPAGHPAAAAVTLIVVEALVALGLILTTGWLFVGTASAALVLTAGLLVAVIRADRLGATEDCGCFGEWLPSAIGPRLVVRNAILTVIAASVLAAALATATRSAPTGIPAALLAGGASAVVAVSALGSGLLIATAVWALVRASDAGPAVDAATPGVFPRGSGALLLPESGEIVDVLAPGTRARLLVFVAPGCHACTTALASLEAAEGALEAVVDLYVVQAAAKGATATEPAHSLPSTARFALDIGGSVSAALGTGPATPVGALIGTDGTQAGPLAMGSAEVAVLVDSIRTLTDASSSA